MKFRHLATLMVVVAIAGPIGAGHEAAAETYRIDDVHSSMFFRIKHLNVSYIYGRINDISGTIILDDGNLAGSSFQVELNAESVDTADERRDAHLKGPDFFDARQFPVIRFQSTGVKKSGTNVYEVSGDMKLHGVTRPMKLRVHRTGEGRNPRGGHIIGFETVFTLKRSDFGMKTVSKPMSVATRT